jgi:hypothetical protein
MPRSRFTVRVSSTPPRELVGYEQLAVVLDWRDSGDADTASFNWYMSAEAAEQLAEALIEAAVDARAKLEQGRREVG